CVRANDVDFTANELCRDVGDAHWPCIRPAIVDRDDAALDPSERTQSLDKRSRPWSPERSVRTHKPNGRQLRCLLRARHTRPSGCRAAEQRDELAALHSITSSALASSVAGTLRPSILPVSALMTSSNLDGCTTGKSAGFAPLRMRPA